MSTVQAFAQSAPAFPAMQKMWDTPAPVVSPLGDSEREDAFRRAERNARLANEMLFRSRKVVDG
ncbi:MAG: hypothetical protein ACYTGQ_14280, partial [Planctomycetota bacterium]